MNRENIDDAIGILQKSPVVINEFVRQTEHGRMRIKIADSALSPTEIIVGLHRLETRLIRPALTQMIDSDMPTMNEYDIAKKATQEGFAAYNLTKTVRAFNETRNISLAMIGRFDQLLLNRPGSIGGKVVTIEEMIIWWASEEFCWLSILPGSSE